MEDYEPIPLDTDVMLPGRTRAEQARIDDERAEIEAQIDKSPVEAQIDLEEQQEWDQQDEIWEEIDGVDRPTTSRRVPTPSPSQYTDYMPPPQEADSAGQPRYGTVTMDELREGDAGGPGSPFLRKERSPDRWATPVAAGLYRDTFDGPSGIPASLERDLQRLVASLERPRTAPRAAW